MFPINSEYIQYSDNLLTNKLWITLWILWITFFMNCQTIWGIFLFIISIINVDIKGFWGGSFQIIQTIQNFCMAIHLILATYFNFSFPSIYSHILPPHSIYHRIWSRSNSTTLLLSQLFSSYLSHSLFLIISHFSQPIYSLTLSLSYIYTIHSHIEL